ncbi:uncharacterized protein LOC144984559 isoform X1 [Oryzias latipes]
MRGMSLRVRQLQVWRRDPLLSRENDVASAAGEEALDSMSEEEEDLSDSVPDARVPAAQVPAALHGDRRPDDTSAEGGGVLGQQAARSGSDLFRAAGDPGEILLSTADVPVREGEQHPTNAATPIRAGGAHGVGPASLKSVPVKGGAQPQNAGSAPGRAGEAADLVPKGMSGMCDAAASAPLEGEIRRREESCGEMSMTSFSLPPQDKVDVTDDVDDSDMEVDRLTLQQRRTLSMKQTGKAKKKKSA